MPTYALTNHLPLRVLTEAHVRHLWEGCSGNGIIAWFFPLRIKCNLKFDFTRVQFREINAYTRLSFRLNSLRLSKALPFFLFFVICQSSTTQSFDTLCALSGLQMSCPLKLTIAIRLIHLIALIFSTLWCVHLLRNKTIVHRLIF